LNDANVPGFVLRNMKQPPTDVCAMLKINPLDKWKDARFLAHFIRDTGMIKPRTETGLSAANQKKLAKAIKRARVAGVIPYTCRPAVADEVGNSFKRFY
ncbi:hypothetical protein HK104_009839, partial [Borealophlyctis nickersoniae]